MKYNKSEIMKAAWAGYKAMRKSAAINYTFAQALKYAWMMAKKAAEKAAKEANKQEFNGYASFNGCTFKMWEKNGMRRIYINSDVKAGKKVMFQEKLGYIDLNANNAMKFVPSYAASTVRAFMDAYKF